MADSLVFSYGSAPVLDGWSAEFSPGEMVGITGRSGRGKSTLLYLLGLMLQPDGGTVSLGGEVVSRLPDAQRARLRARHFGFVFQDHVLDASRSVLDNIVEGSLYRGDDRRSAELAARLLLEKFEVVHRAEARPGQISGGQAQRISLCRALLHHPSILLADEPTGNLDAATASVILDALRQRADEGAVVLIVSHDPVVVGLCDRRIEL